jgi:predicted ribosome quality control (RQC) complex YloA/Tae2 family protein
MTDSRQYISNILEILRERVATRKYSAIALNFDEVVVVGRITEYSGERFSRERFLAALAQAYAASYIDVDFPLQGNLKFIKRVLRKLTYFMFKRLFNEQNMFNTLVCDVFSQMRNFVSEEAARHDSDFEPLLFDMRKKLERQSREIAELRRELRELYDAGTIKEIP